MRTTTALGPTDDQRAAAAAAARAAVSRAGGTEFRDFIDTWSMPEADADRLAVADDICAALRPCCKADRWLPGNRKMQKQCHASAQLVQFRGKPASARARFPREFEIKVTHPFVFAALEETRLPLQRLLAGASLHLYTENAGMIENRLMHRNADAMLFGDAEPSVLRFDARARRDSLVAVEAKRFLNAQGQADALVGGERDFVVVSDDAPSSAMRVGTSVFTDGVEWYFARMAWRFSDRGEWTRVIKMSPAVDVTAPGGWRLLARWFGFAFYQAVTTPREPTGLSQIKWTVGNADSWYLSDVLSSGDRSIVSRWHNGPATAIVKFAVDGVTEARESADSAVFRSRARNVAQVCS
jgi:hypothetical protein